MRPIALYSLKNHGNWTSCLSLPTTTSFSHQVSSAYQRSRPNFGWGHRWARFYSHAAANVRSVLRIVQSETSNIGQCQSFRGSAQLASSVEKRPAAGNQIVE